MTAIYTCSHLDLVSNPLLLKLTEVPLRFETFHSGLLSRWAALFSREVHKLRELLRMHLSLNEHMEVGTPLG